MSSQPHVTVVSSAAQVEDIYADVHLDDHCRVKVQEPNAQMSVVTGKAISSASHVSSIDLNYKTVPEIYMEPIAETSENLMFRGIREFTTALGIVFSAIVIFITELIRIILLKVVRPLLHICILCVRVFIFFIFEVVEIFMAGCCRSIVPCVDLCSDCSHRVIVPIARESRLVVVDNKRYYEYKCTSEGVKHEKRSVEDV